MSSIITAIEAADIAVARAIVPVDDHPLGHLLGRIGDLGDQPPMIGASLLTAGLGLLRRDRRMVAMAVRMLGALALATGLKTLVKRKINRTRPALLIEHGDYDAHFGDTSDRARKSFPSGHTAGVVAIAATVAWSTPGESRLVVAAAAATALVQVPRRSHFVSDVIVGAAIGLLAAALVDAGRRKAAGFAA